MSEAEIYAGLGEIFRDVFLSDDIQLRPELSAKDVPGWDSFKQIDIILAVEEKYRIKLNTRELDSLQNVGDLVRVIAEGGRLSAGVRTRRHGRARPRVGDRFRPVRKQRCLSPFGLVRAGTAP